MKADSNPIEYLQVAKRTKGSERLLGFTMIELLTVLAITAILLALLIPLARNMMASSLSAKCIANLRQCGAAILRAAGENNLQAVLVGGPTGATTWLAEVERVSGVDLDLRQVSLCPSHTPKKFDGNTARVYGVPLSPTLPPFMTTAPGSTGTTRILHFSRLEKPSDYPLLVDSALNNGGVQWRTAWDNGNTATAHARHNGRVNVCKADGSVVTLAPAEYAAMRARNSGNPSLNVIYQNTKGQLLQASGDTGN